MIKIKVCGMTDPFNVKEIAETRPDFMGFIFYPGSPRYVGANPDLTLFKNVPDGILKTGVFVNEDINKILELARIAGLDLIQLHGNESIEYCGSLGSSGLKVIKAFRITEYSDIELVNQFKSVCDYFLFDTNTEGFGGSGRKFNWDLLSGYDIEKQFFLSGGIGPDDVQELRKIKNRGFFAADLNSRFEEAPGRKSGELVKRFIDEYKKISYEL